jgi:hypothetical protein
MVKNHVISIFCCLFNVLAYTPYVESRHRRKPWVTAALAFFAMTLCLRTNFDIMAELWIYPLYFLSGAMEAFDSSKYRLRWSITMQDSPRAFSGVPALDYILRGLVCISAVLLSAGIFLLRAWLELPLLQFPYSILCPSLTLCFLQLVSMDIRLLRRSVEFSYDREAQGTVKILGGLRWLKSPGVYPEIPILFVAPQTKKTQ